MCSSDLDVPDLPSLIRWVLGLGQRLQKPDHDANLKLSDTHLGKVFAGGLTDAAYCKTHDPDNPSPRWLRREREKASRAAREGRPVPVALAAVTPPVVPVPQMLYLLPAVVRPKAKPGRRGYVATGAGMQLAFGF